MIPSFLCTVFSYSLNAQSAVQNSGDTLYITYRANADSVFFKCLQWNIKLSSEGKNWTGILVIPHAQDIMISYSFDEYRAGIKITGRQQEYAGPLAIHQVPFIKKLSGSVENYSLQSKFLNEERTLTIYLPPAYKKSKKYPVVYLTDGKIVKDYAPYVEHLITHNQLPDVILVGVHAGTSSFDVSKDRRGIEYNKGMSKFIPGSDSLAFDNHLRFFCEEVVNYIQNRFSVTRDRRETLLFGYSNGASFTVSAGIYYPEVFGHIISGSISWDLSIKTPAWKPDLYPRYHLAAGRLENDFLKTTRVWGDVLKSDDKEFTLSEFNAGHDPIMWRSFFLDRLEHILSHKRD